MRAVDLIRKKRMGQALSKEEINFFLGAYQNGEVEDYQMSAYLMAVLFCGMEESELIHFTQTMTDSGDTIDLSYMDKFIIDKHSTGGVGDKTSIALAPLLAAMDMGLGKLSGRGLGHTGGTIDKFESIEGFTFSTQIEDMHAMLQNTGIALMSYSDNIVPLDKKIYTLRDVTATVQSIPLIASSIMSKKLAVESDAIILDVKVGNGAFMTTIESARELATTMYSIGKGSGRKIACVLSNMNQPLGHAVGNSLELIEAIETLKGNGPKDFTELILFLASTSLYLRGDVQNIDDGHSIAKEVLDSKKPLQYFANFITASGGNSNIINDYNLLPQAKFTKNVVAQEQGYIHSFDTNALGIAAMTIGAGRATKSDIIDPAVGLLSYKKQGEQVEKGEVLATVHYNDDTHLASCIEKIEQSIYITPTKGEVFPLIFETII